MPGTILTTSPLHPLRLFSPPSVGDEDEAGVVFPVAAAVPAAPTGVEADIGPGGAGSASAEEEEDDDDDEEEPE